ASLPSPSPPSTSSASHLHSLFTPSFFFTDPPPPEIYTLSLHDALPICHNAIAAKLNDGRKGGRGALADHFPLVLSHGGEDVDQRSEEHTSELQSLTNLVCRLLLEKKKT